MKSAIRRVRLAAIFAVAAVMLTSSIPANGQSAATSAPAGGADKAKAMLQRARKEYQAVKFIESQATLTDKGTPWDSLDANDAKARQELLDRIPAAIERQAADKAVYDNAVKAIQDCRLDRVEEIKKAFAATAASEYIDAATRQLAQQNIDRVDGTVALNIAVKAMKEGRLAEAQKGLAAAVANERLSPMTRDNAQKLLAEVNEKIADAAKGGKAAQSAQAKPAEAPTPKVLPQRHEYQKALRAYMATLKPADFEHGVVVPLTNVEGPLIMPPQDANVERQYRNYIMTLMIQPLIGSKRGAPAITVPSNRFVLSAIEANNEAVIMPPVWPETLVSFLQWDYAGNVFHNNKALKMRAFVTAAVNLMMLDDFYEQNPTMGRPDWNGYQLVYVAAPYLGFKDVLPPEVRKAYQDGLRRMGQRFLDWGIRGEAPDLDAIAPMGLWYVSQALEDRDFAKQVEAYARKLYTDGRYFNPAGYWVERGGLDVGFAGQANFFAVTLALASDWPFVKDAVDRLYRLRSHLCLPEPDGKMTGPSEFNCRLGSPASGDQWDWSGAREAAAAMVTDEAASTVALPDANVLAAAAARRAHEFNQQIGERPRTAGGRFISDDEIVGYPWKLRNWSTYNFPASVNPGYEFYRQGAYAHQAKLEKENSPMLKSPFLRGENFTRNFGDAFVVFRQPTYAAILHTGPIGSQDPADGMTQFPGPLGFGGGELAAFWTPASGAVILGRRGGVKFDKSFDKIDEWRTWPIHAVSGVTAEGKFFSSALVAKPQVSVDSKADSAEVKVGGTIPPGIVGQEGGLAGKIEYARTFKVGQGGVHVETSIAGDAKDQVAELCETIPVYLGDPGKGMDANSVPKVTMEFQVAGQWSPAGASYTDKVQAVRVTRFSGALLVTFDQPRRVKLSPAVWADKFLSHATCRTILIDMLESGDKPAAVKAALASYEIKALPK